MADIDYPSNLPQFVLGKNREQEQTFRVNNVFAGSPFAEKITDDNPVQWSGEVFCKDALTARAFLAFVRQVKNFQAFNMPILTENGMVTHEVRFLQEPKAPVQVTQTIWRYSFVIFARELINPDEDIDNDELVAWWIQQAGIIDRACNSSWPEA